MKVFHYSMHEGCASDIKNLLKKYDVDLTTIVPKERPHEKYIVTSERAECMWDEYKDTFLSSDAIIFSDTIPFSRCVLQNLDLLPQSIKVILWITNRFNYAIESDRSYYELLDRVKNDNRVYFLFSNRFERVYFSGFIALPNDKQISFTPYGKRNKDDFNMKNQKNHGGKLFVMSYQNEKEFYPLYDTLKNLGIDFYHKKEWIPKEEYCGPYDIETCSAVLHIPYAWGTVALWEYMALGKTFILPSLKWLDNAYKERYLFFQTHKSIDAISTFSDWYCKDNQDLFVYFDDIEQLSDILNDTDLLKEKGMKCFKRVQENNLQNHTIVENILDL